MVIFIDQSVAVASGLGKYFDLLWLLKRTQWNDVGPSYPAEGLNTSAWAFLIVKSFADLVLVSYTIETILHMTLNHL